MEGNSLENLLLEKSKEQAFSQPLIFDLRNAEDESALHKLFETEEVRHVVDDYDEQLREFFGVCNPSHIFDKDFEQQFQAHRGELVKNSPLWRQGRWVYFPWISTLTHVLEENSFFRVRTARNHNLITIEEQEKFYNSVIGIAGLSVGNSVALAIILQGGGKYLRIADHDRLALSNTNRIRAGVDSLGVRKTELAARQIYLLNPYSNIELYSDGITKENIPQFFDGPQKLDIIIDEVDSLAIKYLIREQAKRCRIPVLMGADNGDGAVIDIERYDREANMPFFHGRLGDVTYEKFASLTKVEIGQTIGRHIGMENVPRRMIESLGEVGKTLVSWPQLGGAAMLNGMAIALCARRILNGQEIEENRALLAPENNLIPDE